MHPTLKTSHQENLRPRLQHTPTANSPVFVHFSTNTKNDQQESDNK